MNLFGFPYCEKDIELDKISIKYSLESYWLSNTQTSYQSDTTATSATISYITQLLQEFTNEFVDIPHYVNIYHIWATEYGHKDFQEPHLHGGSEISFVIFKEISNTDNGLVFYHPAYDLISMNQFWTVFFQDNIQSCTAQVGQIAIFPSFIKHMVKPTNIKRVTYSGNATILPEKNK